MPRPQQGRAAVTEPAASASDLQQSAQPIDREALYRLFEDRHPSVPWAKPPTIANRKAALRRSVWRLLVDGADETMQVALSATQVAEAIAEVSGQRPTNRANVQQALRWLVEAGLLMIVDQGNGERCNIYQLLVRRQEPSVRRKCPPQDPRLRAFDERAAAWSPQRRRAWRAVWRAILASTDNDGQFAGDVAALADAASDSLGIDIADETVAKILGWSVATQLTDQVRAGRAPIYRVRV